MATAHLVVLLSGLLAWSDINIQPAAVIAGSRHSTTLPDGSASDRTLETLKRYELKWPRRQKDVDHVLLSLKTSRAGLPTRACLRACRALLVDGLKQDRWRSAQAIDRFSMRLAMHMITFSTPSWPPAGTVRPEISPGLRYL